MIFHNAFNEDIYGNLICPVCSPKIKFHPLILRYRAKGLSQHVFEYEGNYTSLFKNLRVSLVLVCFTVFDSFIQWTLSADFVL